MLTSPILFSDLGAPHPSPPQAQRPRSTERSNRQCKHRNKKSNHRLSPNLQESATNRDSNQRSDAHGTIESDNPSADISTGAYLSHTCHGKADNAACAEAVEYDGEIEGYDGFVAGREPEEEHGEEGARRGYEEGVEAAHGVAEVGGDEASACGPAVGG